MMDLEVTSDLLKLSQAGFDSFKELLKLIGFFGKMGYEHSKNKTDKYKSGFVSEKDFYEQNYPATSTNVKVPKELTGSSNIQNGKAIATEHWNKFNELLKKHQVAVLIKNDIDLNGDNIIDFNDSYFAVAEDKLFNFQNAYSEYLRWSAQKLHYEKSKPVHLENETEKVKNAVDEKISKINELHNVNVKDISKDISFDLFNEQQKQKILDTIKEISEQKIDFNSITLESILKNQNPDSSLENIKIGKSNLSILSIAKELDSMKDITPDEKLKFFANRIKSEIGENAGTNFLSIKDNRGLFFIDNSNSFIGMNLIENKISVTKDSNFNGKPLWQYARESISAVNNFKEEWNQYLTTLGDNKAFSQDKINYIKNLSDNFIINFDEKGISNNNNAFYQYSELRNYMIHSESNIFEVSDKDRALSSIIKSGNFDARLLDNEIDVSSCWSISYAKQLEFSKEKIDLLFDKNLDSFQRSIIVEINKEAISNNINLSTSDLMSAADMAKEKLDGYKYFNATDKFKDISGDSYYEIKSVVAEKKIDSLVNEKAHLPEINKFKCGNDNHAFTDENNISWYKVTYDSKNNVTVFVNKEKSELLYEATISEQVSEKESILKNKDEVFKNNKNISYFKEGKGKYILSNGDRVIQKSFKLNERSLNVKNEINTNISKNISVGKDR